MAQNPFFNPQQMPQNPMMGQFAQIKNMLAGKNPNQLLAQMAQGQGCTPQQAEMARKFQAMINQGMSPTDVASGSLRNMGIDPNQMKNMF